MGKMQTEGIDKLIHDMENAGDGSGELAEDMLDAGAEVVVQEWKDGIEEAGHVDTGAMRDSVKATGPKNKLERVIYPTGTDKKGVRNAEKAFVLNYGRSKGSTRLAKKDPRRKNTKGQRSSFLGDRFVDKIEEKAAASSQLAMQHVLDEYLRMKGLV